VDQNRFSRRSFLALAMAAPIGASALASCGTAGPGQARSGEASIWYLTGQPQEGLRKASVDAFNAAHPDGKLAATFFENDAYKTRIRTAVGADQAPTVIWTWGGGGLRDYVRNGQVDDLTDWFAQNPEVKSKRFATAFPAATIDGRIYAVPCEQVSPIVMYYNKQLFEQVGAQPPTTWDELMALVPVFNNAGIAPFSLAGQSRWTNMMWLEFLFDRQGGPEVFDAIAAGAPNGWSHPAAIAGLTKVQDLVRANGFVNGFQSIAADANADQALLHQGRAAMMLHGAWTYGNMKTAGKDFVTGGHLGYMNFPGVDGGKGDPSDTVGNPGAYLSISSKATDADKEIAKKFLANNTLDDASVDEWVKSGNIAVAKRAKDRLSSITDKNDADWLKFIYDTSANAKVFAQSWDQALSPTAAEALLDNIAKLFQLQITPQQFAASMNGTIGQ
jgi:raffinose/stachyose/melibiose transport system substrate-binding protein